MTAPERTEAQKAASRANGAKSQGPVTQAGREASSRNAIKHALTAQKFLHPDEAAALPAKRQEWHDYYQPQSPSARSLCDAAASAAVRLGHCLRVGRVRLQARLRAAESAHDQGIVQSLHDLAHKLRDHTHVANAGLEATAEGCAWKIAQLHSLLVALARKRRWSEPEAEQFLNLLNETKVPCERTSFATTIGTRHLACVKAFDLGLKVEPWPRTKSLDDIEDTPAGRASLALRWLRVQGVRAIRRLEIMKAALLPHSLALRKEALETALLDITKEGQLYHRYERAAVLDVQRITRQLEPKLRLGASPPPPPQPPPPAPEPAPAEPPKSSEPASDQPVASSPLDLTKRTREPEHPITSPTPDSPPSDRARGPDG